jgi:hypothetical protein
MENASPRHHSTHRRQLARRVERPCQEIIATATFEQIVWARLDAMEEVLLALQDRVDKMATAADAPHNRSSGAATRSQPSEHLCRDFNPSPTFSKSPSPMNSMSHREDDIATMDYLRHVDDLETRVAKSADPYGGHSHTEMSFASPRLTTPPDNPMPTSEVLVPSVKSSASSLVVQQAPSGRVDPASITRLGVDLRTVSSSLAAAREFLASK